MRCPQMSIVSFLALSCFSYLWLVTADKHETKHFPEQCCNSAMRRAWCFSNVGICLNGRGLWGKAKVLKLLKTSRKRSNSYIAKRRGEVRYRYYVENSKQLGFGAFPHTFITVHTGFVFCKWLEHSFSCKQNYLWIDFSVCTLVSVMQPVAHQQEQIIHIQSKEVADVSKTGIGFWKWW